MFAKKAPANSTLFLDAWRGQTDKKKIEGNVVASWRTDFNFCDVWFIGLVPKKKKLRLFTIPAGITRYAQAWDNIGFRPWKHLVCTISDRITTQKIGFKLHDRNNVILLQSFIYRQLCSPRFRPFFRYCWNRCGYLENKPDYVSPSAYCLAESNSDYGCGSSTVIRCSWCSERFCTDCMFVKQHNCNNFVE